MNALAERIGAKAKGKVAYPADHQVGMRVPLGGSDCAKCEYVNGHKCENKHFQQWHGSEKIPAPINEYCCDFFESKS